MVLCATGISSLQVQPHSISVNSPIERHSRVGAQNRVVRRFACPIGFFRLKGFCYYLSAGTAPWREAHFHCKDRNATLTMLNKRGKDRMLRKYLMGDQFTKLERWIGGIFNWQRAAWEWGVTGEKMDFQNFGRDQPGKSEKYAWHCIIMDPKLRYKWSARNCVERKHYVCEVPAGRIDRRRKAPLNSIAPQNQRLKPQKKRKKYTGEDQKPNKQNRPRSGRKRSWMEQNTDHHWVHGVNLGSRPPNSNKAYPRTRMRHHSNRTHTPYSSPKVSRVLPQGHEYSAFLGDGPSGGHNQPQGLTDMSNVLSQFHASINDFAREEILLKP